MKAIVTRMFKDSLSVSVMSAYVCMVGGLLMMHVWNQYQIMQIGYEVAEVTSAHQRLLEENKKLAIEAAVVGRTERLSDVARERYGLAPVEPGQVRALTFDVADGSGAVVNNEQVALVQ